MDTFKTNLDRKIKDLSDAKLFLDELINNGEVFDPGDSPHDIVWATGIEPSQIELNACGFLIREAHNRFLEVNEDIYEYILESTWE